MLDCCCYNDFECSIYNNFMKGIVSPLEPYNLQTIMVRRLIMYQRIDHPLKIAKTMSLKPVL